MKHPRLTDERALRNGRKSN